MQSKSRIVKRQLRNGNRIIGGIAIADILANSVIVILIVMIMSLSVKQEQDAVEVEKQSEVSSLISRKIATSVVTNALPSSRPAFLHDYVRSSIDKNPTEKTMPVLELHNGFVRNFYTKKIFSEQELFQKNNGFDKYLSQLTKEQRTRVRIDIYGVKLYYIAMSILKDWNVSVRHWHILGYSNNKQIKEAVDNSFADKSELHPDGTILEEYNSTSQFQLQAENYPQDAQLGVPKESAAQKNDESTLQETFDILNILAESSVSLEELQQLLSLPQGENSSYSEVEWEKMNLRQLQELLNKSPELQEKIEALLENQQFSQYRSSQSFRLQIAGEQNSKQQQNSIQLPENEYFLEIFLAVLLSIMEETELLRAKGVVVDIEIQAILNRVAQALQNPEILEDYSHIDLINSLTEKIRAQKVRWKEYIAVKEEKKKDALPYTVTVNFNDYAQEAIFTSNEHQSPLTPLFQKENILQIEQRKYPDIFGTVVVTITKNSLLLLPPHQENPDEFRWRLATVIDHKLTELKLGYIFAAIDTHNNTAILPTDINAVSINNYKPTSLYPTNKFQQDYSVSAASIIFAFIFISSIIYFFRK